VVILALIRSEIVALIGYLESDLPRLCATAEGVGTAAAAGRAAAVPLRDTVDEVAPILASPLTDREQLDRMRDRFVGAIKDAVGAIAQSMNPDLTRHALFEDDAARLETSERLRRDLWCFREMCQLTAKSLEGPSSKSSPVGSLRRFATEFRDVGYQLLRHSDRELFDRFLDLVEGWTAREGEPTQLRMQRLRDDCRRFAEILEKALEAVNKRTELLKVPIDEQAYADLLARHLSGG
jgi:hypothetical protein